jgi:hypothetical protein
MVSMVSPPTVRACPVDHRRTWPRGRRAGPARGRVLSAWMPQSCCWGCVAGTFTPYRRRAGGHHRSHAAGWRAGVSPQPPRGAGRARRRRGRTTRTRHPRAAHHASPWPRPTGQALVPHQITSAREAPHLTPQVSRSTHASRPSCLCRHDPPQQAHLAALTAPEYLAAGPACLLDREL